MIIKPDIKIAPGFTSETGAVYEHQLICKTKCTFRRRNPPYGNPFTWSPRCYVQLKNSYLRRINIGLNLLQVVYPTLCYTFNVVKIFKPSFTLPCVKLNSACPNVDFQRALSLDVEVGVTWHGEIPGVKASLERCLNYKFYYSCILV